jgi:hypothetical protein
MPQPSYETTMTHRRSLMRSPKWEDPEPFPDGCVGGHLPTKNPACIYNAAAVEAIEPEPDIEVVVKLSEPVAAPEDVAARVAEAVQRAVPAPLALSAPAPEPRKIGKDFRGAPMTAGDVLELAAALREQDVALNAVVLAWPDESSRVTRILVSEQP